MLRRHLRRGGSSTATGREEHDALAVLPPRQRAAFVLTGEGLSEPEVADLLRVSPRTAHGAYLRAVATLQEGAVGNQPGQLRPATWTSATEAPPAAEEPGSDRQPLPRIRERARRQRRTLLLRTAAVITLLAIAAGIPPAIRTWQRAHDSRSVRVARGLLDWPARGALAGDGGFVRSATEVWRAEAARAGGAPPATDVRALYAGRLGTGRFAVLEGLAAGRTPWVAVVAEHGPDGATKLTLDAVGRLPARQPPVLVFGYDGNLNVPWLEPAPPSAYYQALVSPRVTRLEQRVFGLKRPNPYPTGFRRLELKDGLSQSWLSVPSGTRGSLRAYRRDALLFEGVMPLAGPVPEPVTVAVVPPPLPPRGDRVSDDQQHADGLLFAERLGGCAVNVSTLWAGLLPDGVPARLLAAGCGGQYGTALAVGSGVRSELADLRPQRPGLRGIDAVAGRTPPSSRTFTAYVVAVARAPSTRLSLLVAGQKVAESTAGVLVAAVPPPTVKCACPDAELRAYDQSDRRLSVGGGVT